MRNVSQASAATLSAVTAVSADGAQRKDMVRCVLRTEGRIPTNGLRVSAEAELGRFPWVVGDVQGWAGNVMEAAVIHQITRASRGMLHLSS